MSEAARKRKRNETARSEAAGRSAVAVAPPKRYQPPASFKQITDKPLVPAETLQDNGTEVWLIQLPPQLDPTSLDGVTWKVRTHVADGELGHLQSSEGDSYSITAEPAALAKQLCVVAPSSGEGRRSFVRQCDRHVSLVKRVPKAGHEDRLPNTPAAQILGTAQHRSIQPTAETDGAERQLAVAEGISAEPSTKKKKKKRRATEEVPS
ncbi:hypothetical protein KFL_002920190 [Klebsormidium nitens]|uniref:Uncharacterized protein n=1 Tax=Klebsormidium nitens TaxID=105231 RepID=A0A1Y1I7J8_KLENI|nr:hypothetical protein KFL_002920190 [Klebsormidium nitens]|eukprot:GAQ86503.1 hypothetical protein KFL_002920190 [Klebsormidium nitens]